MLSANSVNPATRLVLVNAIYFKGNWEKQFNKEHTEERPFRVSKVNKNVSLSEGGSWKRSLGSPWFMERARRLTSRNLSLLWPWRPRCGSGQTLASSPPAPPLLCHQRWSVRRVFCLVSHIPRGSSQVSGPARAPETQFKLQTVAVTLHGPGSYRLTPPVRSYLHRRLSLQGIQEPP